MNEATLAGVRGPVVIACGAPYGGGGTGRHLSEIAEFCRAQGCETTYLAPDTKESPSNGIVVRPNWTRLINRIPPLRYSAAWQGYLESLAFDYGAAKAIPAGHTFIGFNGQCLRSIAAARRLNFNRVITVSATAHVNLCLKQAEKAYAYAPVEPIGHLARHHHRILREYALANHILCASEYVRKSFLDEGFRDEKLVRFNYKPHPRYTPNPPRQRDGKFRIVTIGALVFTKGVAVLLDAFQKFEDADAQLILVGGSGTRQMRKYLEATLARNPRIRIAPGDPLPHLRAADVCVHPSFQDGFAYAPMEALACGVPVIVTDQTGMKEHVREGENGYVVPAGDPNTIVRALRAIRKS